MHDLEDVELALYALEEGWTRAEAGALVGAGGATVSRWASGRVPHPRAQPRARIVRVPVREEDPLNAEERAAYEAAMTENTLLRAVLDDLKGEGSRPGSMSNARKCELGKRLRAATGLPLREITAFLRISKSSYEYHRARLGRDRYGWLRPFVREAFEEVRRRGYRAVWARLRQAGVRVSEKVVRRVMRQEGLVPPFLAGRRKRWSSYAGEASPAPPNLPLRADGTHDFSAPAPNRLWVTDLTEYALPCGPKVYLSPVIDCFDGRPVSWSVGTSPTAALANSSLEAACATLAPGERPVVHSDRGGHYRWEGWISICERFGLVRSMSRKGRSPDNARAEGFFGVAENEFFLARDWAGVGAEAFMRELDDWMRWYREGRAREALGWMAPDEYRRSLGYAV